MFYFKKGEYERCYDINYFKYYIKENGLESIILIEAKRDLGTGVFYCKEHSEVGHVGDSGCGKDCECYDPRNGKSGRCTSSGDVYYPTDQERILNAKSN